MTSNNLISDADMILLDEVRATLHGGGAAVSLAVNGEAELSLSNVREMLREANLKLQKVLDHHGGWDRISTLRGIK